jgi:hypothetical protein
VNLDKEKRLPLHRGIIVFCSKLPLVFDCLLLLIHFFSDAMRLKATSFFVFVLNAKGEKLRSKATGSTTT